MSSHARPACAHFEAETDSEPYSEVDDRTMSQQRQLIPRRWISKIEWTDYVLGDPGVRRRQSSDVAIFRAPNFLKNKKKKDYYVPQRVSLGPLHHGSAELPPMGHHKGRALRRMICRCNVNVEDIMDFANRAMGEILKLEDKIRDSYEENIDCNGETLARMLCLDGCFLLEVLRTQAGDRRSTAMMGKYYDPIFGEEKLDYAACDIADDILMLENQIPFIVLLKLLELELNSAAEAQMYLNVLMTVISAVFNPFDNTNKEEYWSRQLEVHHLLGALHTVIASPTFIEGERVDEGKCSILIPCCSRMLRTRNKAGHGVARIPHAVELRNAGFKFKQSHGGISGIEFDENRATIFLPPISIEDRTERVFRNLIAFEMCKPSQINYVISYVSLMNNLIDKDEDVDLMKRMGVLSNWIGSDKEVIELFNGLGKEVVVVSGNDIFKELKQNVSAHYRNKLKVQFAELARDHSSFAELVREHFSSPWKALALVGAIVMLVLTALQTICTMK